MQTKQLLNKQLTVKDLVLRVSGFGRRARRSCWRNNFPELRWAEYLELEAAAKLPSEERSI